MSKELEAARALVKMLEEREQSNKIKLESLMPGETFFVGENECIVLEQYKGTTKVITKGYPVEARKFTHDSANYKESELKSYIESEIQPAIESEVGSNNLVEHCVNPATVNGQDGYGELTCKVRLLTFSEVRTYINLIVNNNLRGRWWTCTAWSGRNCDFSNFVAVVCPSGYVCSSWCCDENNVRPVFILKSDIFLSRGGSKWLN